MFQATNQNITDQSQLETQIDKRSLKAKPKHTPLEGPMFQDHDQNDRQDRRAVLARSAMNHQSSMPKMGSPDELHEFLIQLMLWIPVQVWEIKALGCAPALHFLSPWLEMTCQTKNPGNYSLCGCTMLEPSLTIIKPYKILLISINQPATKTCASA